jgi:alkaline phosphatase D
VDADGLEPDTWYHYRFRVGDHVSPVGRTRTFPAAGAAPERMRVAVANCQDYQFGRYAAYRHMAADEPDAVLFLGDYIYELPGVDDPDQALAERRYLGGVPETVDDFRLRYAITQLDEDLRAAHHAAPWIVTFDDHEVVNNYAGDDGALAGSGPEFLERRAAAYQAWYEHLPLRIEPPDDEGMVRVHREARFGDLARFLVVETRQHADVPPCRDTSLLDEGPGCAEQDEEGRTALGEEQAGWLLDALAEEGAATWQVLVSPVLLAGLDIAEPGEPPSFYLETWDGYAAERRRIVAALADPAVANPVVLSGDYHASFVADVHLEPRDVASPVVAPELLATAVSSVPFAADHTAANPHVRYFEARNGYLACDITAEAITAEFRYVEDVGDPASPVTTAATFVVTPAPDGGAPTVARA